MGVITIDKKDNNVSIINIKIELLLNKRLFEIKEIPQNLYEKVEESLLHKLNLLEEYSI